VEKPGYRGSCPFGQGEPGKGIQKPEAAAGLEKRLPEKIGENDETHIDFECHYRLSCIPRVRAGRQSGGEGEYRTGKPNFHSACASR
jgi:hypothetical protein